MVDFTRSASSLAPDLSLQLPPQATELFAFDSNCANNPITTSLRISEYSLGDEILTYSLSNNSEGNEWVGIVCSGRIRLLVSDGNKEITAELLEVDRCFGGDRALIENPFAYRAVASSATVKVAKIPLSVIVSAFDANPRLRSYWLEQAQVRERTIFFRTLTALRSHPSRPLRQWMPYLKAINLSPGESLQAATPTENGRYWLRSGEISDLAYESLPDAKSLPNAVSSDTVFSSRAAGVPVVGDSWGYRFDDCDERWVAKETVVIYQLPISAWAIAKAFSPDLDAFSLGTSSQSPEKNSENDGTLAPKQQSVAKHKSLNSIGILDRKSSKFSQKVVLDQSALDLHNSKSKLASTPSSKADVLFPKPPKRIILDALHRYPWVEQQSSSDCGAACLSMVARYWGKRLPLNALRERANVGRAGASLKSLAKAAESIGFHARPVRASLGALASRKNPWVAHWEGSHYIVVYGIGSAQVTIADPAVGRQLISRQQFAQQWTGYGLLLEPTEQLQQTEIKQASLGRYASALLPYRGLILQIIVVSLLIQCFSLVSPLFTQIILDRVVVQKSIPTLNVFAVGLLLFGLFALVMSAVRQYLLSYFSNRLDLTLVSGFIRHTMALPMRFFESRRVGDIITRVQENQKIQQFLIGQIVLAWLNLITGFVYLGLMLYYNWRLTMLVLLMVPPIVVLTLGATPFLRRISRQVFKASADQNSSLVEMVSGIDTVKATATEQTLRWRWEDRLTHQMNARFRGQKLGIGLQSLSGAISSLGGTLLLWYGSMLVIQDSLTIGQFVAFNMMTGYVISPVVALAGLWDELQEVLISVERLNDVFETSPESAQGGLVIPPLEGEVRFENVTFRYNEDEEHNTLQNVSFKVVAGSTVAVVGRSGSGKSTLVKLVEGLYSPNKGRVLIDGHDIAHVEPSALRSQLGVVPQECFLFSGTVLENITLYREDIPFESVVKAAKVAEAHGFIQSFPLGYKTKVGERGATLSGGQRQRVAIARAMLGNPRILLLDEATSSLDTESERQFQKNLERISEHCTTFIIAHRLSTVRNADQIIVLDRGVIVEQGTHEALIEKEGLYYGLAQQQLDL